MNRRLHFIVEGQTEETFVNRLLVPHLSSRSVWGSVRCVMTSRKRGIKFRGGLDKYNRAKDDILRWMKEDHNEDAFFTTMFDLYGLPRDFPGFEEASRIGDPYQRVTTLEEAMREDLQDPRFVPYIQLHEFEALLLAAPQRLARVYFGHDREIQNLIRMSSDFASPELIDDGNQTAPSKRIIAEIPEYEGMKAFAGPLICEAIGLDALREKCRHFADWLEKLEILGRAE